MKSKTKILLGSALTIAMCASLITGSTLALFTSESKTNIAVTSGKVRLEATATLTDVYSADETDNSVSKTVAGFEEGATEATFYNGGTVRYAAPTLKLTNITPGDGVEFSVALTNYSTVSTKYKVVLTADGTDGKELLENLDYSATYEGSMDDPTETWVPLSASSNAETGEALGTVKVNIELPVEAGNSCQGKQCDLTLSVVAVQGNGATCEDTGIHDYRDGERCFWCGEKNPFAAHHTETDDTYTITGVDGGVSELSIPGEIDGKTVEIGSQAFVNDAQLTSVTLGEGITKIGDRAFLACTSLTTVELPDTLKEIEFRAFDGSGISGDLDLPEGLEAIGVNAFRDTHLTSIKVPDSVTSIGNYAFCNSSGNRKQATLTSVELGAGLTSIPQYCFANQEQLESVVIKSATTIDQNAFDGTSNLKHVELPDNLETIEKFAFTGSGIDELSFPASLKEIKQDNIALHKITIPSLEMWFNLTEYDSPNDSRNMLFVGRRFITTLTEPSKYDPEEETKIYVGDSEEPLTDLVVPESVITIRKGAFKGYTFLKSVTLHANVATIDSYAFENCYNLRVVHDSSTAIDVTKQSIQNGYIGAYAVKIFEGTEGEIVTDTTTVDGFEFYTEGGKNYLLGATRNDLETLTMPINYNGESYEIHAYAFTSYFNVKSIVFPTGCQIGSMGDYAFSYCAQVTSIKFQSGCGITKIGDHAFFGCTGPRSSLLDTSAILTVTLAEGCGVTEFGDYAFSSIPELTEFTVPASVTRLGTGTFSGCSHLNSVTFKNTEGWKKQFSTQAPTDVSSTTMANATQMAKNLSNNGNGDAYFKDE